MTYFDHYHDPGHGRLRHLLTSHPGVKDLVKTAQFEDVLEQIPVSAFAWPSKNLYPIHTPSHAALSYLYAKTAQVRVPSVVLHEIKVALDLYGLSQDLFTPQVEKQAALQEDECLFPELQAYPVRSPKEVKTAEERLLPQISKLHPETRATVFHRLVKAAALHDVKLSPKSYKYAGLVHNHRETLVESLRARASATKTAELKTAYMNLAENVKKDPGKASKQTLVKLAEAIGYLDEKAGLQHHYDRTLPDPITTVFNTEKVAFGDEVDLGGYQVRPQALGSMDPKFFSDLLGSDIVRDIAPNGEVDPQLASQILSTLPASEKHLVGQALAHAGVGHAA